MDQEIQKLANFIKTHSRKPFKDDHNKLRYLIGISGIPGSGKTTITKILKQKLNSNDSIAFISLDAWHYPFLDTFEDPIEAHRRRGSPNTFDRESYYNYLKELIKEPKPTKAPMFDHYLKDPILNQIEIKESHQIIIIEGLYTLLNDSDWLKCCELIDLSIFIDVNEESIVKNRLIDRHVSSGICSDKQLAADRVEFNDLPNARYLLENLKTPDFIIRSIEDPNLS